MRFLGIETSCDDCSVAMVEDGRTVLSLVTASQAITHSATGGVVPEIAAREHTVAIMPTIDAALRQAKITLPDVDAIAVTEGPGLMSALLIGTLTASALALSLKKPIVPVHHILGHLYGNFLEREEREIAFPYVVLTASGGHNHLMLARNHHDFTLLGSTRDDAAGEAFDKVARMLGLPYPGGPAIEAAADRGDIKAFDLPRPMLGTGLEFSFSGLKSDVMRIVQRELEKTDRLSKAFVANLSASFQEAVTDVLVTKLLRAATETNVTEVHLAGGVSANGYLRMRVETEAKQRGLSVKYPVKKIYSTDNGAMIAARAYYQARDQLDVYRSSATILPDPRLSLVGHPDPSRSLH